MKRGEVWMKLYAEKMKIYIISKAWVNKYFFQFGRGEYTLCFGYTNNNLFALFSFYREMKYIIILAWFVNNTGGILNLFEVCYETLKMIFMHMSPSW